MANGFKKRADRDAWIKDLPQYDWTEEIRIISEADQLDDLLTAKLDLYYESGETVISLDSESPAVITKGVKSRLGIIQIGTMSQVWIICRAYELSKDERLRWFLSRHKKVGFGIKEDMRRMGLGNHRESEGDRGSYLEINLIGEEPEGLIPKGCPPGARNLCAKLFGLRLSKRYQMTTPWDEFPLSPGAITYAANDVSMHLKIYVELMRRRKLGIITLPQ